MQGAVDRPEPELRTDLWRNQTGGYRRNSGQTLQRYVHDLKTIKYMDKDVIKFSEVSKVFPK